MPLSLSRQAPAASFWAMPFDPDVIRILTCRVESSRGEQKLKVSVANEPVSDYHTAMPNHGARSARAVNV